MGAASCTRSSAREELGLIRGALTGRVAIGLPPSLGKVLAVPLVREFRRQMPEATLSISEGLSLGMQESLASGRLDIALLYNARPSAEIELTALLQEALFLVQRKPPGATRRTRNVAVPLRKVAGLPLVIPTRPNAIRMQVETEMANQGCRPTIALEIDGAAAILELVADGAGSAVLSRHAVETSARPAAFMMRPIGKPPLLSKLSVAVSAHRPATLTQKAMLESIQAIALPLLATRST